METAYVTRQDIVNFPFPYKLWIVVHLDFCDFLRWNRDGTVLLLDLVALEDYLNSTRSIFKIKNRSAFLEHLEGFNFERLNATPEAEEDLLLQYKNENFQRHRLDLVAKMRRHTYELLGEIAMGPSISDSNGTNSGSNVQVTASRKLEAKSRAAERMLGDLCFMSHGGLSNVQTSRLRFQTILSFQSETRILREKLQASEDWAAQQRRLKSDVLARTAAGQSVGAVQEEEQVIELPVELFENPHDSVLHLGEDFRPEYAGYYGNCSKEQIMHFFGDYLPMYEDGSMEVRKIVADTSVFNQNVITSDGELERGQSGNQVYQNEIDPNSSATLTSAPVAQPSMPTLDFSSVLEPIFKTDEDEDHVETTNNNNNIPPIVNNSVEPEAEISMDEFIKFKGSDEDGSVDKKPELDDISTPMEAISQDFPQMPTAVKMELTDGDDIVENEANFRNFFSQYRASLNLLYGRH